MVSEVTSLRVHDSKFPQKMAVVPNNLILSALYYQEAHPLLQLR